jgi:uridine kinase
MKAYIIGICGGSGSGKTSFIRRLRERFPVEDLCIVSQDDYYRPREEQLCDDQGVVNFDLPGAIDKKALRSDLHRLLSGSVVHRQEYTFNNDKAVARVHTYHPAPVLIVEGLFIFHYKKIAPLFDLKIFINSKDNLKVIRRIMRDQVERNYPIEDVLYRYQHHVLPSYERYIRPYQDDADLIVNNNRNFEGGLAVVSSFIRQRLSESVCP